MPCDSWLRCSSPTNTSGTPCTSTMPPWCGHATTGLSRLRRHLSANQPAWRWPEWEGLVCSTCPPYGEHEERLCPPCTDNFQVVPDGFEYDGIIWHSVEQAFQSLKFPMGSIAQLEIERAAPRPDESEASYSMRTWSLGQPRRDTSMREDWGRSRSRS